MTERLEYGINPASGAFGEGWPASGAIPQSYSAAGWTLGNEGFIQQTFLGASITEFNVNGGFGDSTSTLSVTLVDDEYNKSDGLGLGLGDDVYHNGKKDTFSPPPVGTPVFFKFGKNHATVEQAWRKTFDTLYFWNTIDPLPALEIDMRSGLKTLAGGEYVSVEDSVFYEDQYAVVDRSAHLDPDYNGRGSGHFVFGGILQAYSESSSAGGPHTYQITVIDPREILANTTLILNNYADSVFNCPNLLNVYGFLEFNPPIKLRKKLDDYYNLLGLLTKGINQDGTMQYNGAISPELTDSYLTKNFYDNYYSQNTLGALRDSFVSSILEDGTLPGTFPYTGSSYSRRCEKGIPFYRIIQAINSMMEINGSMPDEYRSKGFGGRINFRGFNYVVDFSSLPLNRIPAMYYMDFDQMNMLELCQEICEVISHDLYIELLPVINHPGSQYFHSYNKQQILLGNYTNIITGIIKVQAISRTVKPEYGAVSRYIKGLEAQGINVTNKNVGYELSNVPTDKFIVGGQEVEMHYFTANNDRDLLEVRKDINGLDNRLGSELSEQWFLTNSLKQQVLPFYGFLGKDAVSVPRGYGSFQQIMLDTSSLHAHGVGNYYVTTEMELRAASRSFQEWKDFLLNYNDQYMDSMEENDIFEDTILTQFIVPSGEERRMYDALPKDISNNYGVVVPRSVFMSEKDFMGEDGYPASPCNPPFGYPLYFKRASKIGIVEAGLVGVDNRQQIVTNLKELNKQDGKNWKNLLGSSMYQTIFKDRPNMTKDEIELIKEIRADLEDPKNFNEQDILGILDKIFDSNSKIYTDLPRMSQQSTDNAMKVYDFLRNVASQNLGKKFLVKIPRVANVFYSPHISTTKGDTNFPSPEDQAGALRINELKWGPFGFRPRAISPQIDYAYGFQFNSELYSLRNFINSNNTGYTKSYLDYGIGTNIIQDYLDSNDGGVFDRTQGALRAEYNSISDKYEFNYSPEPQGGFFEFDLYNNLLTEDHLRQLPDSSLFPLGTQQSLMPQDMTNFLDDSNRVSCYAKFENSQYLNFKDMPTDSFVQQAIGLDGEIISDITYQFENMSPQEGVDLEKDEHGKIVPDDRPNSVAFVKCSLDDRFYMPPKVISRKTKVFGRAVENKHTFTPPIRVFNQETGEYGTTLSIYRPRYVPQSPNGGEAGVSVTQEDFSRVQNYDKTGWVIDTSPINQDISHVYVLITLPAMITPLVDGRFWDSEKQKYNAMSFKRLLTMDVVKGVAGFEVPAFKGRPSTFSCEAYNLYDLKKGKFVISDNALASAAGAYKAAMSNKSHSQLIELNTTQPSPVYPDMVSVPLLSKERTYGPWLSNTVPRDSQGFTAIPGKVEFIKDENLSPWNYAGYSLLNEAGTLQAQFSNSLQLMSEKGSITFEGMPSGNALGQYLIQGGPIITDMSVSVNGSNGVTTTYNMNVYTPRFGKLQAQRDQMIGQISRERQRVTDERNALIRKGMGKSQKAVNYTVLAENLKTGVLGGIVELTDRWTQNLYAAQDMKIQEMSDSQEVNRAVVNSEGDTTVSTITKATSIIAPERQIRDGKQRQPNNLDKKSADARTANKPTGFTVQDIPNGTPNNGVSIVSHAYPTDRRT